MLLCTYPALFISLLTHSSLTIERALAGMVRDCSVHYVLPKTSLTPLLVAGKLSVQQVAYAYVAWKFAFHFLNRDTAEIRSLQDALGGAGGDASLKLVRASVCFAYIRCVSLVQTVRDVVVLLAWSRLVHA